MTSEDTPRALPPRVIEILYLFVALYFVVELFRYYLTGSGGPTLLAVTLVPITFVLFTLDALRKDELYPRLGPAANYAIAAAYAAVAVGVAVYMHVEFIAIGTVRAGFWSTTDLALGGLMAVLVMEYARRRYFVLFALNLGLILYFRRLKLAKPSVESTPPPRNPLTMIWRFAAQKLFEHASRDTIGQEGGKLGPDLVELRR